MWRFPDDERVLTAEEAPLFRMGLRALFRSIAKGKSNTGVLPFDRLTVEQKLFLLAYVGRAALDPSFPRPELTLYTESTLAAVFAIIRRRLRREIRIKPESRKWRSRLLAAVRDDEAWTLDGDEDQPPRIDDRDWSKWKEAYEYYYVRLAHDEDWMLEPKLADLDPKHAQAVKEFGRIDTDYFAQPAPEPSQKAVTESRQWLEKLSL